MDRQTLDQSKEKDINEKYININFIIILCFVYYLL